MLIGDVYLIEKGVDFLHDPWVSLVGAMLLLQLFEESLAPDLCDVLDVCLGGNVDLWELHADDLVCVFCCGWLVEEREQKKAGSQTSPK